MKHYPTPRPVFWLVGSVVLVLLMWRLRDVVMLCFGVIIVTAILRALAAPVARLTHVSQRVAVVAVALTGLVLLGAGLAALGDPLAVQMQELRTALPKAWEAVRSWLEHDRLGAKLLEGVNAASGTSVPWSRVASAATLATGFITDVFLMGVMGLYLALDPGLYKRGLVRLFPPRRRTVVSDALDAAGDGLSRWLMGQAVAMVLVGVTVAIGLALLDVSLWAALGLIAGLLEFVPFFGPIASGLTAVLVAFAQGPTQALYVAILFIALQQIEGNVLMPFVQRWAVNLPPVLGVLAVVLFGSLFGVSGVVFGTPLMVVAMILVERLHVQRMEKDAAPQEPAAQLP